MVSVVGGCGERERGAATKGREAWQYCMEHGGQAADVARKVVGKIDMLLLGLMKVLSSCIMETSLFHEAV